LGQGVVQGGAAVVRWADVEISTDPAKPPPAKRGRGKAAAGAAEEPPATAPIEAPTAAPDAPVVPVAAPGPAVEGAPLAPPVAPLTQPPPTPARPAAFEVVSLVDAMPAEARQPLSVAAAVVPTGEPPADVPAADVAMVPGVICSRGHFNNPDSLFCSLCGISMVQQTKNVVTGPRPPLGVIVFDDGSAFTLDADYVVGREPQVDELVQHGAARPLMIQDPENALSRVHLVIQLQGWKVNVVDRNSANGTHIFPPRAQAWARLSPGVPAEIGSGTYVSVGRRTFFYDSHHR
jgi:hypothetical protein